MLQARDITSLQPLTATTRGGDPKPAKKAVSSSERVMLRKKSMSHPAPGLDALGTGDEQKFFAVNVTHLTLVRHARLDDRKKLASATPGGRSAIESRGQKYICRFA